MTTSGDQLTPETSSENAQETCPESAQESAQKTGSEPPPEIAPEAVPEAVPEPVVIAGAPSQMLARLLVGVIVFGVVVSGAYIVTRRSESPAAATPVPPPVPTVVSAPAPAPPASQAALVSLPVVTPTVAASPILEVKAPTATVTPDISSEETKGHTFLQVGAVDRAEAANYVRELGAKGFAARIAEGPQPNIARILIGPVSGPDLTAMQSRLTEAGVASFQKSY